MKRVFSGIQPTNDLHIGNYLGAIRPWVTHQNTGENYFCVVDLHALTAARDPLSLSRSIRRTVATYLACGICPEKSHIFLQSQVPGHCQLAWILNCFTPLGWLNRMTQFKDKAGKDRDHASLGLYAYPVLQAADILLYQATHVPVGEDQKQHIELCRDIGGAFNHKLGVDFFTLPQAEIPNTPEARVMSLRDATMKMSKSDPSAYGRIHLSDCPETIALKIRKAKTDGNPLGASLEDMETRPEARNLLTLYAAFSEQSLVQTCAEFSGAQFSGFKEKLSELLITKLTPIQQRLKEFLETPEILESIIEKGTEHARQRAQKTIEEVFALVGLGGACDIESAAPWS